MILRFWKKQVKDDNLNIENNENNEESQHSEILDFFKDLIIIVIIVVVVRSYIAMPFQISGQSMYSSYYDREFIIVDRISYILGKPERGDVIVFKPYVNDAKKYFLKRIIGVPGDILKIEDGNVFIKKSINDDFVKLNEDYLNSENNGYTFVGINKDTKIYSLGEDQYFVMGDNRNHSTDSRECFSNCVGRSEFITKNDMIGKVFLDLGYFNFKKIGFIQPELGIDTTPRFFSSPSTFNHDL
ncbi:MAG: signal peptidase I [Candidatus Gracilibacteria bacterium]|nr:signal peptidase I [Candidatus Gracilibacteria bacterium]